MLITDTTPLNMNQIIKKFKNKLILVIKSIQFKNKLSRKEMKTHSKSFKRRRDLINKDLKDLFKISTFKRV